MHKTVATLTIVQLVRRCQAPVTDREAFAELLRRHYDHIDRLIYYLAPDHPQRDVLMQKLWVKVYDQIDQLTVPSEFRSWVSRLTAQWVIAEAQAHRAKRSVWSTKVVKAVTGWCRLSQPLPHPTPPHLMLADLPETIRITMVLRDIGGFCYDSIADLTNVTSDIVKARLAQGAFQLRHYYLNSEA